jgi:hypothetical protein
MDIATYLGARWRKEGCRALGQHVPRNREEQCVSLEVCLILIYQQHVAEVVDSNRAP